MRETGMGQQVAQLHERLMMTMMQRKFKITETNGYNVFGEWTGTDCHNYEISTTWETRPWTTPPKTLDC